MRKIETNGTKLSKHRARQERVHLSRDRTQVPGENSVEAEANRANRAADQKLLQGLAGMLCRETDEHAGKIGLRGQPEKAHGKRTLAKIIGHDIVRQVIGNRFAKIFIVIWFP